MREKISWMIIGIMLTTSVSLIAWTAKTLFKVSNQTGRLEGGVEEIKKVVVKNSECIEELEKQTNRQETRITILEY